MEVACGWEGQGGGGGRGWLRGAGSSRGQGRCPKVAVVPAAQVCEPKSTGLCASPGRLGRCLNDVAAEPLTIRKQRSPVGDCADQLEAWLARDTGLSLNLLILRFI